MFEDIQWFCAETHPWQEFHAKFHLHRQGFDTLLPTYVKDSKTHKARLLPLFPGYIFVAFSYSMRWQAIRSTHGVKRLLSLEPPVPTPVPRTTIEAIVSIVERESTKEGSVIPENAQIIVKRGRQRDLVGLCAWSTKDRVGLLKSILGQEVIFEFPRNNVYVLEENSNSNV